MGRGRSSSLPKTISLRRGDCFVNGERASQRMIHTYYEETIHLFRSIGGQYLQKVKAPDKAGNGYSLRLTILLLIFSI